MRIAAEALAATLRERMDRYNAALDADENADRAEILSPETAALQRDLIVAAVADEPSQVADLDRADAGLLWVAAWAAEFRDNAFARAGDETASRTEAANAMRLFLVVDRLQPDLVPAHQRTRLDRLNATSAVLDLAYRERELAEVLLSGEDTDLAALDVSIALLRSSIEHDAGDRVEHWHALMRALWRRYGSVSHLDDAAQAVDAAEHALALAHESSRVVALRQIGVMEQARFDRTGAAASLNRCLAVLAEALELTPAGDQQRAATMVSLGIALRTKGHRERSPDDLNRAVALTREALSDPTLGPAHRASAMSMLALALHARFTLTSSEHDLEEAVAVAREASSIDVAEDRGVRLGNLGLVLVSRHHRSRSHADLAELVAVARQKLTLPGDRHQHGIALGLLAIALTYRAEAFGRLDDLTEAIEAARGAAAALTDHSDRSLHLHNLAKALLRRYENTHSIDDLDESIEIGRLAVSVQSGDDPRRAGQLSGLAGALEVRYRLHDNIDDLLGAIATGEEAVLCSPPSSAEHADLLSNLSNARRALAERTRQVTDSDAAIHVAEQALSIGGQSTLPRPTRLMNLASCHVARFRITGDVTDLDRAVSLLQEALAGVSELSPARCTYLSELGQRLVERFDADAVRREPSTLGQAIEMLREAASHRAAPAADRVLAAARWGLAAAGHGLHDQAAAGYASAVRLLPLAAWHGLERRSQERQLTTWNPIITSAAAWAIDLDRPAEAVELLEQGRGVLWAHQLGRRVDLTALRAVRPDLADRLEESRTALGADAGGTER
ncbi:hypothetical protein Rhe02_34080 [Rhizocola hellebori]|uniref:Tetratricopeptide repeat protein n=1 Tax=Rhizocola hellebori TaxID=1392758 RepID=A0A8J3Q7M5_9ACTN|nr:tetratricopeptide repeat protein [Rhizocola hellebori]GIH05341.1 hypothetical protein Rhe02_34080 [Rhizocola hellebori]